MSLRRFCNPSGHGVKIGRSRTPWLTAAAALAGKDKSAWMARAIMDALKGVVVIDRRKSPDGAKSPDEVIDSDAPGD